jgi:hypothetical protein
MSPLLFATAIAVLVPAGFLTARWLRLGELSRAAAVPVLAAAGSVILAAEMLLLDSFRVAWRVDLLVAPAIAGAAAMAIGARSRRTSVPAHPLSGRARAMLAVAALELAVAFFLAATGHMTSPDYVTFWGTKGQRFAALGSIDVTFLRLIHPDYPPMVPLLETWGSTVAGGFDWMGPTVFLPVFLALAALGFWGLSRETLGEARAAELTAIFAGLLAYLGLVDLNAGGAEGPLWFFEALALCALLLRGGGARDRIAGVALAGAVWTKAEGAAFAFLVLVAFSAARARRGKMLPFLRDAAILPAAAFGAWALYCRTHGLAPRFRVETVTTIELRLLPGVLLAIARNAGYHAAYLPWIVVLLAIPGGKPGREQLAAAACAAGFTGILVMIYMHGGEVPRQMIGWSASRALVSPVVCLFLAAATAPGPGPGEAQSLREAMSCANPS